VTLSGAFREAMARFPSGVTVVAARSGPEVRAMTASAFCSVSLEPPLLLLALSNEARLLPLLQRAGRFAVSLLAEEQKDLSEHFAGRKSTETAVLTGDPPHVPEALAVLACSLWQSYPAGDHTLVLGQVERVELGALRSPLVYWHRQYRRIA